jgi:PEP-CTERM motif
MNVRRLLQFATILLSLCCTSIATASVVIDFQSGVVTVAGDTRTYQQDGFTLSSTTTVSNFGIPSAQWKDWWGFGGVAATSFSFWNKVFDVEANGSLFTIQSLLIAETTSDFGNACPLYPINSAHGSFVSITGWVGASKVLDWGAHASCPAGAFSEVANSFGGTAVDRLEFEAPGLSYISVDNIVLTPVPEPTTYALMVAGLSVLGFIARRRKSSAV